MLCRVGAVVSWPTRSGFESDPEGSDIWRANWPSPTDWPMPICLPRLFISFVEKNKWLMNILKRSLPSRVNMD